MILTHKLPSHWEIWSMSVCVCVCVRERERERESSQLHIRKIYLTEGWTENHFNESTRIKVTKETVERCLPFPRNA